MSKIKLSDHFNYGPTETVYRQPSPECNILVNKQLRKAYGKKKNKVYLNDGDNIQLNLFNPLYHRIGVQLEFNGEKEEKMLILNPGQKVLLDRFIDTKKKIKFGTYFVDGSKSEVKEAIKKNGNMVVHFWYEKLKQPTYTSSTSGWSGPDGLYGSSGNPGTSGNPVTSGGGGGIWPIDKSKANKKWAPIIDSMGVTDPTKRDWMSEYAENHQLNDTIAHSTLRNMNGMGSITTSNSNSRIYDNATYLSQVSEPKLEETGRVEKGDKSKQKMKETDFEVDRVFYVKEFKLLPFSKMKDSKKKTQNGLANNFKPKSVTVDVHNSYRNTDHRIYCSNPMCGYRVRNQSWQYCPICGGEIE